MNDWLYQKTQVATQLLRKRTEISVHRIAHAHAMSRSCMGTRSQSDVAGRPRNSTPRRAALMFAGSMAASRTIRPAAADRVVDGINNPTAPASSARPVRSTNTSGRGRAGGTIAIRSFFIGAKCDVAVNRNIVASATRALTIHESSGGTSAKPRSRQSKQEPNSTKRTAIRITWLAERLAHLDLDARTFMFSENHYLLGNLKQNRASRLALNRMLRSRRCI